MACKVPKPGIEPHLAQIVNSYTLIFLKKEIMINYLGNAKITAKQLITASSVLPLSKTVLVLTTSYLKLAFLSPYIELTINNSIFETERKSIFILSSSGHPENTEEENA